MVPVVTTFLPAPMSFNNTLKHLVALQEFKVNTSFFASILHAGVLQNAAAPVIDVTRKANVKMHNNLPIFCIILILLFSLTNI
jgi:hypothetical protein